jgi:hypothetical protein
MSQSLGDTTALMTTVILWPWTGIIMIASGVLYVILVGEPTSGAQRHHWWPYVGWAIVAFIFVSMALLALYATNCCCIYLTAATDLPAIMIAGNSDVPMAVDSRRIRFH